MRIEKLSLVMRLFLELIFVVGLGDMFFLHSLLPLFFGSTFEGIMVPSLALLYASAAACLVGIRLIIALLQSVKKETPFIAKNAKILSGIAVCSFAVTLCMLILQVLVNNVVVSLFALIFFVAGISCIILSALFKKAVEFKAENDLMV